jgi:hypothetical protein
MACDPSTCPHKCCVHSPSESRCGDKAECKTGNIFFSDLILPAIVVVCVVVGVVVVGGAIMAWRESKK